MKTYTLTCTIEVSDSRKFDPDEVAERVRDEIAGSVEDDRDTNRDFDYLGTAVEMIHSSTPPRHKRDASDCDCYRCTGKTPRD